MISSEDDCDDIESLSSSSSTPRRPTPRPRPTRLRTLRQHLRAAAASDSVRPRPSEERMEGEEEGEGHLRYSSPFIADSHDPFDRARSAAPFHPFHSSSALPSSRPSARPRPFALSLVDRLQAETFSRCAVVSPLHPPAPLSRPRVSAADSSPPFPPSVAVAVPLPGPRCDASAQVAPVRAASPPFHCPHSHLLPHPSAAVRPLRTALTCPPAASTEWAPCWRSPAATAECSCSTQTSSTARASER